MSGLFDKLGVGFKSGIPLLELAKGNIPGHSHINKFGHLAAATTGDDIWGGGGVYPFYPTAAVAIDIVSSSIEDDPDKGGATPGTGAFQVIVYGLDSNWNIQTETVTLNGQGVVQLTKTYVRLYRAFVYEAGTGNGNAGNITVYARANGSGLTIGDVGIYIAAAGGQTQHAIYTVPNGKTAYFIKGYVSLLNDTFQGESGTFRWLMRLNDGVNGAWLTQGEMGLINIGSSHWQYEYGVPAGPIPGRTDIRIELTTATAAMDTAAGYDLILVDDGY
jgi:hypothetical protein